MRLYWNDSFFSCLWCSHLLGIAFFLSWCFSAVFVNDEHDERRRQRRTVHRIFFKYYHWESNRWFRAFLILIQFWLFKDSRRLRLNWINIFFFSFTVVCFCIVLIRCCCWFLLGGIFAFALITVIIEPFTQLLTAISVLLIRIGEETTENCDTKLKTIVNRRLECEIIHINCAHEPNLFCRRHSRRQRLLNLVSIFGARIIRTTSPRCACALEWIEKRVWRQCRNRADKDLDSDKIRKIENSEKGYRRQLIRLK